jgi:hypothetical protein
MIGAVPPFLAEPLAEAAWAEHRLAQACECRKPHPCWSPAFDHRIEIASMSTFPACRASPPITARG